MNKKEWILRDFNDLYNKMVWLNNSMMCDKFGDLKSSEVHCIEYIGSNADSNVTQLAEAFYMTKGAISKLTNKLIKKGFIENYQMQDNKQKIYFRLTPQGQAIYEIHEKMHKEFSERDKIIFDQISEEQFCSMSKFVENYSRHLDAEIEKIKQK